MRRVRFGAFLALSLLTGALFADVADANPAATTVAIEGQFESGSFQVIGAGGATPGTLVFGRTLTCRPCAVTAAIGSSSLLVEGGGNAGLLPGYATYTFAGFYGLVGVTRGFDGAYVVTMIGGAEAIREDPPYSS